MRHLKIGTSSVRGVVGDELTPEIVANFACAFGTWCEAGTVVIGRDTRASSSMLRAAVTSGLLATGCEILDLGLASTPLIAFAVRELGAGGGLAITGSHNDGSWNALKFIGPDGALLNAVKTEELLDLYHASHFHRASWDQLRPVAGGIDVAGRYLDHLLAGLDAEAIRPRRFRVAVDFCNGPLAPLAARYFDALGCTLLPIHAEPTGHFAHAPAPRPEHMATLVHEATGRGADLGAALNVDGDRVAFVTHDGAALSEEYTLPLAARTRLRRRAGTIVTNLSTSKMVDAVAHAFGQQVLRTAVGESHVIELGSAEGAVLAGEGSGGVAVLPGGLAFDGLLTLGLVLEEMAVGGSSLRDLADELPRLAMRKQELPCPPNLVHRVVEGFRQRHSESDPDGSDGVRVSWPDGWLHVRASNTEPLLRVIVETTTPERAEAVLADTLGYARRAMQGHGASA